MSMRDQIAKAIVSRIKAWHSSPYDFDKFDLSKIGSGQGAATYGPGIYAAESPAVSGRGGEYWKEFARRMQHPDVSAEMAHAIQILEHTGGDRVGALKLAEEAIGKRTGYHQDQIKRVRDLLASDKQIGPRTYELNIKADPQSFLQWDQPLSKQPKAVQDIYSRSVSYPKPTDRGEEIYHSLSRNIPPEFAGKPDWTLSSLHTRPDPQHGMNELRDAGIPGIRYLDAGSREHAELQKIIAQSISPDRVQIATDKMQNLAPPTYNYVINNPDIIDIAKKYGIPAAIAGPAIGAVAAQDEYRQ